MPRRLIALIILALFAVGSARAANWGKLRETPPPAPPISVLMETSEGDVRLRLDGQRAPKSVANFLAYVRSGYYEGMIFHRVIPGFMAQGGGVDTQFQRRPMLDPIRNEADNGLKNRRGTIALARTGDPHSATSEFFINLVDNPKLDANLDNWGYTVFGVVESGMDTMDRIASIPTGAGGSFDSDVPQTMVVIRKISIIDTAAEATPAEPVTAPASPAAPTP